MPPFSARAFAWGWGYAYLAFFGGDAAGVCDAGPGGGDGISTAVLWRCVRPWVFIRRFFFHALEAKLGVGLRVQAAEVGRLVRLLSVVCAATGDAPNVRPERLRRAVSALLVSMDRYRAYVHVGGCPPHSAAALADATAKARRLPASDHEALDLVAGLVTGQVADRGDEPADPAVQAARRAELVVRFQQTCGPIQAKGIEDTAFYRWAPLAGLNEVGSHPGEFATAPEELASFADNLLVWPATMTTLTTHDTKRSEDTRAALAVLSELPDEWRVGRAGPTSGPGGPPCRARRGSIPRPTTCSGRPSWPPFRSRRT